MKNILLPVIILIMIGCNPYKRLAKRPPLTGSDTLRLSQRCIAAFPMPEQEYIKGDTVYISPDSLTYWQIKADSFKNAEPLKITELQIKYKDTCTSVMDEYKNGFDLGYQVGLYEGKKSVKPIHDLRVDTVIRKDTREVAAANIIIRKQQDDVEKYRGRAEGRGRWNMWLIIALAVSLIVNILLWKFRRSASAANTAINKIQNLKQ